MDYEFLRVFQPLTSATTDAELQAMVPTAESQALSYFQRSVLEYMMSLLEPLSNEEGQQWFRMGDKTLYSFLIETIGQASGEDIDAFLLVLFEGLTAKYQVSKASLGIQLLNRLSKKAEGLSVFDQSLLYLLMSELLTDPGTRSERLSSLTDVGRLLDYLITHRASHRAVFNVLFSYPEVLESIQSSGTSLESTRVQTLEAGEEQAFRLNYFQQMLLDYLSGLLDTLSRTRNADFSISQESLAKATADYLSTTETEVYESLFPGWLTRLSEESGISVAVWAQALLETVLEKKYKSQNDYRFLAVFKSYVSENQSDAVVLYIPQAEVDQLSFFKRNIFDYLFDLIVNLKTKSGLKSTVPEETIVSAVLLDFVSDVKGEDVSKIFQNFLKVFTVQFGLSVSEFQLEVLELLATKEKEVLFDSTFLFLLVDGLMDETSKISSRLSELNVTEKLFKKLIKKRNENKAIFKKIVARAEFVESIGDETFINIFTSYGAENQFVFTLITRRIVTSASKASAKATVSKLRRHAAIIFLEQEGQVRSVTFIKEMVRRLKAHDSKLYELLTKQIDEQSVIQEILKAESIQFSIDAIVNKPNPTSEIKNQQNETENILSQFEFQLYLKNEGEFEVTTTDHNNIGFTSLAEILKDDKSVVGFLAQNKNDFELVVAFATLSLDGHINTVLKKIVNKIHGALNDFETAWLSIYNQNLIVNLNKNAFALVLRIFILRKLLQPNRKDLIAITYEFLKILQRGQNLNFNSWYNFTGKELQIVGSDKIELGVAIFFEKNKYTAIQPKIRQEVSYSDLIFYWFKFQENPKWATEKITKKAAIIHIKEQVEKGNKAFLDQLVLDIQAGQMLFDTLKSESLDFQSRLLQLFQDSNAPFKIEVLYRKIVNAFMDAGYENVRILRQALFVFFFEEKLWTKTSQVMVGKLLQVYLERETSLSKERIREVIHLGIPLWKQLDSTKEEAQFNEAELVEMALHYINLGMFPSDLVKKNSLMFQRIRALLKVPEHFKSVMAYQRLNAARTKNLLMFITRKDLSDILITHYFSGEPILLHLSGFLIKQMSSLSQNVYIPLFVVLSETIMKDNTNPKSFTIFFRKLSQLQPKISEALDNFIASNIRPADLKKNSVLREVLFVSDNKMRMFLEQENNLGGAFDILLYYSEFGSLNYQNNQLRTADLRKHLTQLIENDNFKAKKLLHDSARFMYKFQRLYNLMAQQQSRLLLDLIHEDLAEDFEKTVRVFKKYLDLDVRSLLSLKEEKNIHTFLFKKWAMGPLIIDNTMEILEAIVSGVISKSKLSKETLLQRLREGIAEVKDKTDIAFFEILSNYLTQNLAAEKLSDETLVKTEEQTIKEEDTIYIDNAGLVILWPFLGHLFQRLELMEDPKTFKNETAQNKAILLTQHLVTGQTEFEESALVLNKLICGAPINQYVDIAMPIEPNEIETCTSMLKNAVLKNWGSLSKSSIEALRETFLMREGILKKGYQEYVLIVKNNTVDLLMKDISWSFSIIQTAFMQERIVVEWL